MKYDVVIIGGGPGGYGCALSCAGYGLKTALVEKRELGGTCLNRGCIPTKTLLFTAGLLENLKKSSLFGIRDGRGEADFEGLRKRSAQVVSTLRSGVAKLLRQRRVDVYQGIGKVISPTLVELESKDGKAGWKRTISSLPPAALLRCRPFREARCPASTPVTVSWKSCRR